MFVSFVVILTPIFSRNVRVRLLQFDNLDDIYITFSLRKTLKKLNDGVSTPGDTLSLGGNLFLEVVLWGSIGVLFSLAWPILLIALVLLTILHSTLKRK